MEMAATFGVGESRAIGDIGGSAAMAAIRFAAGDTRSRIRAYPKTSPRLRESFYGEVFG